MPVGPSRGLKPIAAHCFGGSEVTRVGSEKTAGSQLPSTSPLARAIAVLDELAERGSATPGELQVATELPRPTLYRLLRILESEHLVARDDAGRHRIGLRVLAWATSLRALSTIVECVRPVLVRLRTDTGESVQLYVREGDARVCVASFEPSTGLRVTVPTGSVLPLHLGSGGKAMLAFSPDGEHFGIAKSELERIRKQRWSASVAEREVGVASVSSAIVDADENVVAVIAVSGPIDRFGTNPGPKFGRLVAGAAQEASMLLRRAAVIK
jgi:DNA-binding IclR family transcriptional regulator